MNTLIDNITQAMADLYKLTDLKSTTDHVAHEHLVQARRLLVAKYQPQTGPTGD